MALKNLKENIEMAKELIKEISILSSQLANSENLSAEEKRPIERRMLTEALNSYMERLRILNNSTPKILDAISPFRKLGTEEKEEAVEKVKDLVKLSYTPEAKKEERVSVTIEKKQREKFLKELGLTKDIVKRLKKGGNELKEERFFEFKKPSWYAKISNRFFLSLSTKFFNKGKLERLNSNLRKANMPFLVTTYLSIIFFSSLIALFLGLIIFVSLLFFGELSFVSVLRNILVIPLLPLITFFSLYTYPYAERKGIEVKINQELPFIVIHMSAIAGSGIEPTHIFKIIAFGEEYPNTKKELKKIINQVNVYGYDLITALKNTARETSSRKLSELFNGIATTISGGGSLSEFLDKRAETLLFEYRLERERHTKTAETFMDIYISIVIAAPMIMTLLLVLITISGISIGLSLGQLTAVILSIVALINIIFLVFLHLSQPGY